MRFIASLAALVLLSACATAAPSTPPAASTIPAGSTGSVSSSRQAQLLRAAGGSDAPSLQDVERYFGQADIVRRDGAGTALTYRFENCALLLLFAADARNAMRWLRSPTFASTHAFTCWSSRYELLIGAHPRYIH